MADRRQRERRERRQAILESAERLFREHPYDQVRVEEIAAAAEVGKGTVYLYFPDKDAIVAELAAAVLSRLRAEGTEIVGLVRVGGLTALSGLRRLLVGWTRAYEEVPWLFRLLVLDRPRLLVAGLADSGIADGLLAPVEDLVRMGRDRGEGLGPADPEVVGRALWALFVGGLLLERRGEVDPADIRREGLSVLLALVRGFSVPDPGNADRPGAAGPEMGC